MRTASQAVAAARAATRNRDDMCLAEVQGWFAAPWSGPYAEDAWNRWGGQHPGDRNPPVGAPVYFHSPRHRYGHIALALPGPTGAIRSTDWPRDTYVGDTTIAEMEARWGIRYLGWSSRFSGGNIVFDWHSSAPASPPHFKTNTVYVHVCREGAVNMDSVHNVQRRLIDLGFPIPAGPTGTWPVGGQTTHALAAWQASIHNTGEWATGKKLGSSQAAKLFAGTGVRVVE